MSQYEWPTTQSGRALIDSLNDLNLSFPAIYTSHKGPFRPTYVQRGGIWVSDAAGAVWAANIYAGNGANAVFANIDSAAGNVMRTAEAPTFAFVDALSNSDTSWTVPTGVYYVWVVAKGAGGGGIGAGNGALYRGGGGGGTWAGGVNVTPGQVILVSVGSRGLGSSVAPAGTGGSTLFGSYGTAYGGQGAGADGAGDRSGAGGTGSAQTGVIFPGNAGGLCGGSSGGPFSGGGGKHISSASGTGANGTHFGAGGGGNNHPTERGGNAADGRIWIFYNRAV